LYAVPIDEAYGFRHVMMCHGDVGHGYLSEMEDVSDLSDEDKNDDGGGEVSMLKSSSSLTTNPNKLMWLRQSTLYSIVQCWRVRLAVGKYLFGLYVTEAMT
jgi:hypothetical protein